jgi:hypothetical protein
MLSLKLSKLSELNKNYNVNVRRERVECLEYLLCGADDLHFVMFLESENWEINVTILIHKCLIIIIT